MSQPNNAARAVLERDAARAALADVKTPLPERMRPLHCRGCSCDLCFTVDAISWPCSYCGAPVHSAMYVAQEHRTFCTSRGHTMLEPIATRQ